MQQQPNYIALQITNNSSEIVMPIILGGPINPGIANQPITLYEYDLSAENWIGVTTIGLVYKNLLTNITTATTLPLITNNIDSAAIALNQIGIGTWTYSGTTIYYQSNDYEPKKLSLA